jgi:type II secretory pathway predicted ATPase ExeA
LRLALTDFLLKNFAAGKRAVFVVDEAHHLPPDALEELRLLANLESRRGQAVQIVLAGHSSLLETLRRPDLASLAQRAAVRVRLDALPLEEAADYLLHQLRGAGARPEAVVTDEALEVLARGSGGVPRLLNQAAHLALLMAFSAGATLVDAEAALEALTVLGMRVEDTPAEGEGSSGGSLAARLTEYEEPSCRLFGAPRPA